jgi:hypothetical protein
MTLAAIEVQDQKSDVVFLSERGLVGPGGDFGDEVVGELVGGNGMMGFDVPHDAVEAVLLLGGVGGFGDAVGIQDVAIAGLQRDFERGVFGVADHS